MSKFDKYRKKLKEGSPPEEPSKLSVEHAQAYSEPRALLSYSPAEDGSNFLKSFLRATPFFDLFEYLAYRLYAGKLPVRTAKMRVEQPGFYVFCVIADTAVRCITVVVVLVLATMAAFKVIG